MGLEVGVPRLRDAVCGKESLGMRPRSFRPCGMQRALSACRPGTPEWGLLGVPPLLWVLRGQKGASMLGPVVNNGENISYTAQVRLHDLGHTACRGSLVCVLSLQYTTPPAQVTQNNLGRAT